MPVILIIIEHPINRWPHKPLAHASFVGWFIKLFVMYEENRERGIYANKNFINNVINN